MVDKKQSRQVNFLNLGRDEFVRDLQNYSKVFFQDKSRDLSPNSSAQLMIEQASFIGDVLAFYLEQRFRNSNMVSATDVSSVYNLAQFLRYNPVGPSPARGDTNFYLEVPSTTGSAGDFIPDMRYAVNFKNVQLQNTSGIIFEALDDVDFTKVNISSSLEAKVSKINDDGSPSHFVLKTNEEVISARTITETATIGEYKAFREVEITEPNVVDVISVVDADGEEWFEVDFLAQEAIFEGVRNLGDDSATVPYNLKLRTVPRRFIKKVNPKTGKTTLIFGSGKATEVGTSFIPDPAELAVDLKGKLTFSSPFIDPQNFLKTRTLGLAPINTTLTIKARVGGGSITNTSVGSLSEIISKQADFASAGLNTVEVNNTLRSFATRNTNSIIGGEEPESIRDIKENSSALFAAQGRLTTREDYIGRTLSMPSKFGRVFRVYASRNCNTNGGVQLYILAKNELGQIITPTQSLKKNVKNYLSKFTRFGQGIDILDGLIINIGIDVSIVVQSGLNKTETKVKAIKAIKDYFNINEWSLSQPIIIDEIRCLLKDIQGIVSIPELIIKNKNNNSNGLQYSETVFSVEGNTKNGIIFIPDNAIFEIKYPNVDLRVGAL